MSTIDVLEAKMEFHDERTKRVEEAVATLADTVNKFISAQNVFNAETKLKIALASGATSLIISIAVAVGMKLWIK